MACALPNAKHDQCLTRTLQLPTERAVGGSIGIHVWMPPGVRPRGWTRSRGVFDRGAGVLVLERGGAEIPQG